MRKALKGVGSGNIAVCSGTSVGRTHVDDDTGALAVVVVGVVVEPSAATGAPPAVAGPFAAVVASRAPDAARA